MNTKVILKRLTYYARRVGRVAARPMVLLYFVLRDPVTPQDDKYVIYGALAYILLPIDIIPAKVIPLIGWADEGGAIALMYKRVKKNITPAIEMQTDKFLDIICPVYTVANDVAER